MKSRLKDGLKVKNFILEDMVARELKDGIKELGNLVPLIQNFIAPIFNLAEQLQEQIENINIHMSQDLLNMISYYY